MKTPLPPILSTALSASQPWPVTVTRPALHYQPLDYMAQIRQKEADAGAYVLPSSPLDLFADLKESQDVNDPFFKTALGLLYLSRQGFVDGCHALVTPLSWHDETLVGYGPPTPGTPAEVVATYAHILVHRWEGSNIGELNMSGYSNSMFWGKATVRRAGTTPAPEVVPYGRIRKEMEGLLLLKENECKVSSGMELSPEALAAGIEWFQEWIASDLPEGGWEPRALNELCKTVEVNHQQGDPIAEFGAVANQLECDVLIYHCLERAGYEVPSTQQGTDSNDGHLQDGSATNNDNNGEALRAASKVSSAHISYFQQNGKIVIRNVLSSQKEEAIAMQSAIAVACRSLGTPACATASNAPQNAPGAYVYFTESHKTVLGFDLGPGDVLVASLDLAETASVSWKGVLVPCQNDDPSAVYKDPLFGTRGETPTTVIQWSKGTIF